jgi:hypothetical protein
VSTSLPSRLLDEFGHAVSEIASSPTRPNLSLELRKLLVHSQPQIILSRYPTAHDRTLLARPGHETSPITKWPTTQGWSPKAIHLNPATTPPTLGPGGVTFAYARNPSALTITLTGSGTFQPGDPGAVTGGGTWETFNGNTSTGSGSYEVTGLVFWRLGSLQTGGASLT